MKLFGRLPGGSRDSLYYLRCWAHRVLDAARAGVDVDAEVIEQALRLTGDLE